MNIKPKIGFVILVWNSEKVIGKCLQSISHLQETQPSVVVVDNGSVDKTLEIISQYNGQLDLKVIQYEENKGTTVSRNAGLREVRNNKPDYYCILDSDTEINDDAFLKLIKEMQGHPEYGLIGPTMVTSQGLVQMSARAFPTALEKLYKAIPIKALQVKGEAMENQNPDNPGAESYPVDYLMSACWLIKPDLLDEVGLLDEKIFYAPEDAEYCIRVWKAGYQVAFCPDATIIHEWQRLSKKKLFSKVNWEHIKGLIYMFRKHHYFASTNQLKKTFPVRRAQEVITA